MLFLDYNDKIREIIFYLIFEGYNVRQNVITASSDNTAIEEFKSGINCFHHKDRGSVSGQSTWVCGEQIGSRTGFALSLAVTPCQYHSTNAPCSFIHLIQTLKNRRK
jgi:hypothetical protein